MKLSKNELRRPWISNPAQPFSCAIPPTIPGWLIGQSDRRSTDPSTDPIPDPSISQGLQHPLARSAFLHSLAFALHFFLRPRTSHTDYT
ncbi:hypothetical protein ASPTUDRAFT_37908, partial [Aspergillus tubingensis CBS 134.48]